MAKEQALVDVLADAELSQLCRSLPKVELHCHLSGSFRRTSLQKLERSMGHQATLHVLPPNNPYTVDVWSNCTWVFDNIANATNPGGLETLYTLTTEVIEDFAADGVVYAELRIGLKEWPTRRDYLDTLVKAIRDASQSVPGIDVRLLLSFARHGKPASYDDILTVAKTFFDEEKLSDAKPILVGVELGGVPHAKSWKSEIEPIFESLRDHGLQVALHCAENTDAREHDDMLAFSPGRLGHCVFLTDKSMASLKEKKIPVEVCLTCHRDFYNIPYANNIFKTLNAGDDPHPVVLCTDNPTLFDCTLTQEYVVACKTFRLTATQLFALSIGAIEASFCNNDTKCSLRSSFEETHATLRKQYGI